MESIIAIIKKIAEQEAEKIFTTEIGIVTSVFPHASQSDTDNYQCSVKLKYRKKPDGGDFELRKVPVMTPHIGMVNIPNVGDLVVLSFAGGNINAPIIIGRLYNNEDQQPVNKEKEFILRHSLSDGSILKMDDQGVLTLSSPQEKTMLELKDGSLKVSTANGQVTLKIEDSGLTIDTGTNPVTIKSMGEVKIGDATTPKISVGGRILSGAVGDNDDIILTTHTHLGNLGAPCPILIPMEKINSIQAKGRNTQVG